MKEGTPAAVGAARAYGSMKTSKKNHRQANGKSNSRSESAVERATRLIGEYRSREADLLGDIVSGKLPAETFDAVRHQTGSPMPRIPVDVASEKLAGRALQAFIDAMPDEVRLGAMNEDQRAAFDLVVSALQAVARNATPAERESVRRARGVLLGGRSEEAIEHRHREGMKIVERLRAEQFEPDTCRKALVIRVDPRCERLTDEQIIEAFSKRDRKAQGILADLYISAGIETKLGSESLAEARDRLSKKIKKTASNSP